MRLLARLAGPAAVAAVLLVMVVVPSALQFAHTDDALAAPGDHLWSKRFGGPNDQFAGSVAVDGTGNVLLTGAFAGTVDFGGGPLTSAGAYDIFVAKFDSAGNHLWSKRFGDASAQYGQSVAVDPAGNALLTGYFAGTADFGGGPLTSGGANDIFVAKLASVGTTYSVGGIAEQPDVTALPSTAMYSRRDYKVYVLGAVVAFIVAVAGAAGWRKRGT